MDYTQNPATLREWAPHRGLVVFSAEKSDVTVQKDAANTDRYVDVQYLALRRPLFFPGARANVNSTRFTIARALKKGCTSSDFLPPEKLGRK